MKNSAAYWQGQASNHTLQRVYGVTFPDKKELAQVLKFFAAQEHNPQP
jgi:threonyl-tRNA synthetase